MGKSKDCTNTKCPEYARFETYNCDRWLKAAINGCHEFDGSPKTATSSGSECIGLLNAIPQQEDRQDTLTMQTNDLLLFAEKLGMRDAVKNINLGRYGDGSFGST